LGAYSVYRCKSCDLFFTLPVPSPEALRTLYSDNYYRGPRAARFRLPLGDKLQQGFRWWRAKILARRLGGRIAGSRILDVGCGRGYTLAWLSRWGADVYGTQLSASAAETAKQHIGADRVFVGELSEAGFADHRFDCVTLWHVLEHTPDPLAILKEVSRILKPGGLVYIEVPNAGGWSARTFGRHWLAYDVPKHLVHFTPQTLEALARKAGFTCIRQVHSSLEYSPATLLQSALSAWLGGEHLLFRLASLEIPVADLRRQTKLGRILLHVGAAAMLAVPAASLSLFLSWRRQGDTMGFYFRHAKASSS